MSTEKNCPFLPASQDEKNKGAVQVTKCMGELCALYWEDKQRCCLKELAMKK